MSPPKRPISQKQLSPRHLRRSDLRGLVRLATHATEGVTRITEGVHQSVWSTLGVAGRAPQRTGGLTGLVYRSVGGITRGVGRGIDRALARIEPMLDGRGAVVDGPDSARRTAWLSALNGVMGDRLAADGSPFAIEMSLRHEGVALDLQPTKAIAAPRRRILLMIHGLCMNDLQWCTSEAGRSHDHGRVVAEALDCSAIYLRYNTGRRVAQNGSELADRLEELLRNWPLPIDEISVLAHSMGGLVIRSALHQAGLRGFGWPARVRHVVFLGTPHHGAPLERAGHLVELMLASSRWSAPFVQLAGLRSAGIIDLRHGNVLEAADEHTTSQRRGDRRVPLPLPPGIHCHAIAATTAARSGPLANRLIGDGLVPLNSALGRHRDPRHRLVFADGSTWISYRTGHLGLLSRTTVAARIVSWLGA